MKLFPMLSFFLLCIGSLAASDDAFLGVGLEKATTELGKTEEGVRITYVMLGSPAREGGLRQHDIVTAINDVTVSSPKMLIEEIQKFEPEDEVILHVQRDSDSLKLKVKLGKKQQPALAARRFIEVMDLKRNFIGVHTETLNPQLAEYFGVEKGALVMKVTEDSPAEVAGIKAGDIITGWNDLHVESSQDLGKAVRESEADQVATITVKRRGELIDLPVTPEIREDAEMEFGNRRFGALAPQPSNGFRYEFKNDFKFPEGDFPMPKESWQVVPKPDGVKVAPQVWHFRGDSEMRDEVKALQEQVEELKKLVEELKKK